MMKGEPRAVVRKKIFILLSRIPYPLEKGDKLRAYHQIKELSQHHTLILCCLNDTKIHPKAFERLKPFAEALYIFPLRKSGIIGRLCRALFSSTPFQVAYFYSPGIHKQIKALIAKHQPDHLFCQLIRTTRYADGSDTDNTLDYQDVFSAGLLRRHRIAPWYKKMLLKMEYRRVLSFENKAFDQFNKHVIISIPDRNLIPHPARKSIAVIPNGVDTIFFKPMDHPKQYDIIFTGNMGYPPNINGASFLVRQVMPLVWAKIPATNVAIVGASPAASVKSLASPLVTVTGWVDDIRTYYAASSIFVAPMQIGTGLQNKVLEAMAMKLPCITSPLANEALMAKENNQVLIGRNAPEYAQHILSLLTETKKYNNLSKAGHHFVLQHFNWQSTTARLAAIITR